MPEDDFIKGSELDRLAGVVSRQIDQGFNGVDNRITELGDRFGKFEEGVTSTLRDHGEKIAVLTARSEWRSAPVAQEPVTTRKRAAFYGTGAGTAAVFLWSALKAAATWIFNSGSHK